MYPGRANILLTLPLWEGEQFGERFRELGEAKGGEGPSAGILYFIFLVRRHTYKHRGFGCSAQPQVLEPVLFVLALLRELFHPGLAGLQRVSRRRGQAAQQAHGPAPLRGLQGAACIGPSAEERPSTSLGLGWAGGSGPLRNDLSRRFTWRLARPEIL